MTDVLTNPAWHALIGAHARARGQRTASLAATTPTSRCSTRSTTPTAEAWERPSHALATNGVVVLFREAPLPPPPDGWRTVFAGEGYQMVRRASSPALPPLPATDPDTGRRVTIARRSPTTTSTRWSTSSLAPSPVRFAAARSSSAGTSASSTTTRSSPWPVGDSGPPGYCEVSAVCTDPTRAPPRLRVDRDGARRRRRSPSRRRHADAARRRRQRLGAAPSYEQLGFEVSRKCGFAAMQVPRSPQ